MKIVKDDREGTDVLTVTGKLDSTNASEFDARLREDIDESSGRTVILDFAGVLTLTSAPLRAILSLAKRMQRHGAMLVVAAPGENALESLRISGFLKLKIFELSDTLEAALALARQSARQPAKPRAAAPAGGPLPGLPPLPVAIPPPASPDPPPKPQPVTPPPPAKPLPTPPANSQPNEPTAPAPSEPPPAPPAQPPPRIANPFALPRQSARPSDPKPAPTPEPPTPPVPETKPAPKSEPKPEPPPAPKPPPAPERESEPARVSPPVATTPPRVSMPPVEPGQLLPSREPGLLGWFNFWAGEVQNALDYWVGMFRRK